MILRNSRRVLRTKLAIKINTHIQPTHLKFAGSQNKNKFNVQTKSSKITLGEKYKQRLHNCSKDTHRSAAKP